MAITISGENNNDRILAQDGVIDEISGINFSGIITASHINVGSNIQLGNAGIITATTFVGNVTGNVNSTSPLLLQTGGSERFRITGNNELGIAGANYGTAGQVLTSGGSGNAVTWSAIPTQVTINDNADNRVITGSGSANTLNGESEFTYTGGVLKVAATYPSFYLDDTNTTNNRFRIIHNNQLTQFDADPNNVYSGSFINISIDGSEKVRITENCDITATSTSAGATGPTLKLFHNSASPAANDVVSRISMVGDDAAGNETIYSRIETVIDDPTDSQETAHINFATRGLGSYANVFRIKRRSTASAPSYTADDADGMILDVYNTGNPYPRYMNFIAKSAGNTDSNIAFWTEAVGGSPTEKLRITSGGNLLVHKTSTSDYGKFEVKGGTADNIETADITAKTIATFSGSTPGTTAAGKGAGIVIKPIADRGCNYFIGVANDGTNQEAHGRFIIRSGNFAGTTIERFRITSGGSVRVGDNSSFSAHTAADDLVVGATSGSNGMTILTGSATGNIFFNDGSGNDGVVQYVHSSSPNYMRIASSGHIRFDAARMSISDDNIAPTAGDMASGASFGIPRLHMRGDNAQSGAYELMARFQSGTDANDSGATIVLNHSNDRGLALQGGRGQSNRSFGAIKSIDNLGRLSDCIDYLGGNGQGVNYLRFFTGESTTTSERFRIGSSGQFGIAGANYGTSGQVLTSQGSSSAPQWATPSSGVSMVDEWRLSTNLTNGGSESYITSNWVRNSTNGFSGGVGVIGGAIGSAMSVSSGYFSFPSTGIYKVEFNINYSINDADTKYFEANIIGTKNNSTYTVLARSYGPPIHSNVHNEPMYGHAYTAVIFDVTNTSNCKFRLNYSCQTSSNTIIGGGYNATHVTVTRLGDT